MRFASSVPRRAVASLVSIPLALALVFTAAGCSATPSASSTASSAADTPTSAPARPKGTPVVYKVTDSNGGYLQPSISSLYGHGEQTIALNVHVGTGWRITLPPRKDVTTSMRARVLSDLSTMNPTMVLIETGGVDTSDPSGYQNYGEVIDALLDDPALTNRPVAWLQVPKLTMAPPMTTTGADAINAALVAAEATHKNLWAVPSQQIWDDAFVGQCPVLDTKTGKWSPQPLASCFVDLGHDPHYDPVKGQTLASIIEDAVIQATLGGKSHKNGQLIAGIKKTVAPS